MIWCWPSAVGYCMCVFVRCIWMFRMWKSERRCNLHRIFFLVHQFWAVGASRANITAFIALLSTLIYTWYAHASYVLQSHAFLESRVRAYRTWLRHLQHTCTWGVALMSFLFLCSFPAPLLSVALAFQFAILSSISVVLFPAFLSLKIEIFPLINVFLCFSISFSPEAHFHYFAERSSWLITEENYVEYPPNTIYVLTRLKSGSNALPGEIGKIR